RDLPAHVKGLQHQADVPTSVPAVRQPVVGRLVLELAREERTAPLELAQHVAAKPRVLLQELAPPPVALVRRRPAVPPHPCTEQRERFDRIDERVELDERPLLPQQAVELGGVERAEAAPEDEVLWRRDGRDRIELEEPEPAHRLEDAARRAVEQLRADGDPTSVLWADRDASSAHVRCGNGEERSG